VLPETQEHFVPQMVNLERLGGVDFHKGCYPGQEVVARTQYRGVLKRRMVRARVAAPASPATRSTRTRHPARRAAPS
jgi:tRNA-modifying protein YgfZ